MRPDSVKSTVLHTQRHDPSAAAILVHDQIQGKVLDCSQEVRVQLGAPGVGVGRYEGGSKDQMFSCVPLKRTCREGMRKHV